MKVTISGILYCLHNYPSNFIKMWWCLKKKPYICLMIMVLSEGNKRHVTSNQQIAKIVKYRITISVHRVLYLLTWFWSVVIKNELLQFSQERNIGAAKNARIATSLYSAAAVVVYSLCATIKLECAYFLLVTTSCNGFYKTMPMYIVEELSSVGTWSYERLLIHKPTNMHLLPLNHSSACLPPGGH